MRETVTECAARIVKEAERDGVLEALRNAPHGTAVRRARSGGKVTVRTVRSEPPGTAPATRQLTVEKDTQACSIAVPWAIKDEHGKLQSCHATEQMAKDHIPRSASVSHNQRGAGGVEMRYGLSSSGWRCRINQDAVDLICRHAQATGLYLETAGPLFGIVDGQVIRVRAAFGAGVNADAAAGSFTPDGERDTALAERIAEETDGQYVELGGWHTHPNGADRPSDADVRKAARMREIFGRAHPGQPHLEIIATPSDDPTWAKSPWDRPALTAWLLRDGPFGPVCERTPLDVTAWQA